jgi:hypothetical protein
MSNLTEAQENIVAGLNAADWEEVINEFANQTIEQIKSELDKMFWSDTDVNGKFAQEIFEEVN